MIPANWHQRFDSKKILILGFGMEGQSTYNFFRTHFPSSHLAVMDQNEDYVRSLIKDESTFIYTKDTYLKPIGPIDYVFKSPGVPLKTIEEVFDSKQILSQTQLFIEAFRDRIIGISGTKGKTTTASFMAFFLNMLGKQVKLVGNIGIPVLDEIFEDDGETIYVYELSSHQLEVVTVSPKYAILLNLFEEHLDHYHSFDHYAFAKLNLFKYQVPGDLRIYNQDNEVLNQFVSRLNPVKDLEVLTFGHQILEEGLRIEEETLSLHYGQQRVHIPLDISKQIRGTHNLLNALISGLIAMVWSSYDHQVMLEALAEFKGVPHRLEFIGSYHGIDFYNDSIATIPAATLAAIKAIKNTSSVIVGGMDRGIDYQLLLEYIADSSHLQWILLPNTGHRFYDQLGQPSHCHKAENMEEAVRLAYQVTKSQGACLLSPAAASYGFYKNFEARGKHFCQLVEQGVKDL